MSGAWAAFARTGNPSSKEIGQWTQYDAKSRPTMILDKECRMENDPRSEQRQLDYEVLLPVGGCRHAAA